TAAHAAILNSFKEYGRGGWIRTNAWQDQNLLPYRLATPLFSFRMPGIRFSSPFPKLSMQHRNVATASDNSWQGCWKLAQNFISFGLIWEGPKYATTGAG